MLFNDTNNKPDPNAFKHTLTIIIVMEMRVRIAIFPSPSRSEMATNKEAVGD